MFTRERLTRWTTSLRENAHKQGVRALECEKGTQCCLGHLASVEGIPKEKTDYGLCLYRFPAVKNALDSSEYFKCSAVTLCGELAKELGGGGVGVFAVMNMPKLIYRGYEAGSLSDANDSHVPWGVIAQHLDDYYPCSDEPPRERPSYPVKYE